MVNKDLKRLRFKIKADKRRKKRLKDKSKKIIKKVNNMPNNFNRMDFSPPTNEISKNKSNVLTKFDTDAWKPHE